MKTVKHILAATLLIPCAVLWSCSKGVDPVEESPAEETSPETEESLDVIFTATLAPKDGAATKVITPGTDAQDKEILNVSWAVGELIGIYYQKEDQKEDLSYARGYAKVTAVDPVTGAATVEAHLSAPLGGEAKFIYPYTLMNENGEMDMTPFRKQDGTINYISNNLDAATTTVTIVRDGGTASVSGSVQMESRCCICKFSFTGIGSDPEENYYEITIREKEGESTINRYLAPNITKGNMGAVYMALLGAEGKDFTFFIQGYHKNYPDDISATQKRSYSKSMAGVTLSAGRFYRSLNVPFCDVLDLSKGNVTARDGDVIVQSGGPTSNTIIVENGATVTISGVNIEANEAGIICSGSATIILEGSNLITAGISEAAIQNIGPLTITGSGALEVHANGRGAAIGGREYVPCGDITISGGTIIAYGKSLGAAIGSGQSGSCGNIIISGGTITAYGGIMSAAIGAGQNGTCGNITITNGVDYLHAETVDDDDHDDHDHEKICIGYGRDGNCSGSITIGSEVYYSNGAFQGDGHDILKHRVLKYNPTDYGLIATD